MARGRAIVLAAALAALTGVFGDLDRSADNHGTTWLPRDLEPLHYGVRIKPVLIEGNFTAPGELVFTFSTRSPTNKIVLNVRDLLIDEESVTVQEESVAGSWSPLQVRDHSYNTDLETYTILLGATMNPLSPRHRLKLRYVAKIADNNRGLYRMRHTDAEGITWWVAATQLGPTNARAVFPCMDEPRHKARFSLSIAHPVGYKTVANMPISTTESASDGWQWDHYHESVPMSTYLVAFAVFNFERYVPGYTAANGANNASGVTFNVWARPSQVQRGWYAARIGPQILNFYERFFDLPFPLPKQDMLALPQLIFEAMENWGLITYRENALLVDPSDEVLSKHHVAATVAHELAHQWFGNLVTMKWWNDVWLNEGFATFVSQIGLNQVEPEWRSEESFVLDTVKKVMEDDAMPGSHPVSREVYRTEDIDDVFDSISYKKGASIIRMMSHFLGERAFHAGLNLYLQRHRYGSASQDDLWAALTETVLAGYNQNTHGDTLLPPGLSVKEVMDSWTLQTGYPVVTVTRDYCQGTADVRQDRFLVIAGDHHTVFGPEPERWWIPLWMTSSARRPRQLPMQWMADVPRTNISGLPGRADWVLLNAQRAGFYRVNYDNTNWRLLIEALRSGSLPELARAGLVDDALALAYAGRLDYSTTLDLVHTLSADHAALPWAAAIPALRDLIHLLHGTPAAAPFKEWAREVVRDVYRSVVNQRDFTNPVLKAHHDRVLHWACEVDLPACVKRARMDFLFWKTTPRGVRPPTLLCAALRHGTQDDYILVALKYWSTRDVRLLKALGCSKDHGFLKSLLSWMSPSSLGSASQSEATKLFTTIAGNPHGHSLALAYLIDNWAQLQKSYGSQTTKVMAITAARHSKTESQLQKLAALLKAPTPDNVTRALQRGRHNVWWVQHKIGYVQNWIRGKTPNHQVWYFISN